jgi:hypothetical protein
MFLMKLLIANKRALKSILADMGEGSELEIISTYELVGYGTDGSGYPTYKLSSQEYKLN